jgi:N-acetylglutamate synthase
MGVSYRPMQPTDFPAALALWGTLPGICIQDVDTPAALTRFLVRNTGCSWVAEAEGELVATCLAGHDGRRGFLYHLAVRADHQRQGIGRTVVGHCRDQFRAAGIHKIHILVLSDNSDGFAFWERLGFARRTDVTLMSWTDRGSEGSCS